MLLKKTYVCGIGAQKAGTTFLSNYLYNHPSFMMSELKELHYFDSKMIPELCPGFESKILGSIDNLTTNFLKGGKTDPKRLIALIKRIEAGRKNNYKLFFRYFVKQRHLAFGEITPEYAMLNREHYAEIASMFPNHKFIFLLRNPVERFWSQINYEIQNNKSDANPIDLIDKKIESQGYLLRCNYKRTIEEVLSVINEKNFHIEFYENIFSENIKESIATISNFIGIEFKEELLDIDNKINSTPYISLLNEENRMKIVGKLAETYKYIIDNYDTPDSWKVDYEKV